VTALVVVVGATGNVGRRLVRRLVDQEIPVRALTRDAARARSFMPTEVEILEVLLDQAGQVDRALDGGTAVFLACGNGPRQAELEDAVVQAAARCEVSRLVKLSSVSAAIEPSSFHRRIEESIERTGLTYTHLRPSMFMQSLLTLAELPLVDSGELRLPLGAARIDAVDVRDVADAACHALVERGDRSEAWALLGWRLPMQTVASVLAQALGRPIRYVDVSPEQARLEWAEAEIAEPMKNALAGIFESLRTMDPVRLRDDLERAARHPARTWADAGTGLGDSNGDWRDLNLLDAMRPRVELAAQEL
jgi:uncharacterized protein YbjT (DUF2867 family)